MVDAELAQRQRAASGPGQRIPLGLAAVARRCRVPRRRACARAGDRPLHARRGRRYRRRDAGRHRCPDHQRPAARAARRAQSRWAAAADPAAADEGRMSLDQARDAPAAPGEPRPGAGCPARVRDAVQAGARKRHQLWRLPDQDRVSDPRVRQATAGARAPERGGVHRGRWPGDDRDGLTRPGGPGPDQHARWRAGM